MKVIYPICAGIDVHKKSFTIAVNSTKKDGSYTVKTKTFTTMYDDILRAREWLIESNCIDVAMESTGKYWIPIFNLFEDHLRVTLANPRYTKTFPGNKTDPRDARWLSELHRIGLVAPSFIPPKAIREFRELTRYRVKLIKIRTSEKSRIQNSLTVSNIMLSSVAADIFGKSGMSIIHTLLLEKEITEELLSKLVSGKLKSKIPELMLALKGKLSNVQADKLRIALDIFLSINEKISSIENLIEEKSKPYERMITLLCTIPGVKRIAAISILSEIGTNMAVFYSSSHLCSRAGVSPGNNQSAGKRKPAGSKRGNLYLKSILVQCANAAVKDTSTILHSKFTAIKARRGHNKAIVAICRSMLIAIYHMLTKNEAYKEPVKAKKTKSPIKEEKLVEQLRALGYKVEKAAS